MIDRIKELTNTLEQELTNGLNNLPEYQGTLESSDLQISEGKQNKQNHFGNIVWFVPICQLDRHQIRYLF